MPWLRLYADGTPQIETYGEIWQLFWLFHNRLPFFFVGTSSSLVEKFHASCLLLLFAPVIYERLRSVMDAEMEMLVPCAKSMKCLRLHIAIYNNGMHSVEIQQKHLNSLAPFTRTHTPSAQCIPRINRIPIVNGIE